MAYRVSKQNGLLTDATAWYQTTNTPSPQTASQTNVGAGTASTAFTAPNTTNSVVGVMFYLIAGAGNSSNLTITLQESLVNTSAAVTLTAANMRNNTWYFLAFPTPYTFTTTTASAYRFNFVRSSGAGTITVCNDAGSIPMGIAVDNRTAAPVTGDNLWVIGSTADGSSPVTITLSGTSNPTGLGSSTSPSTVTNRVPNAINVGVGGILAVDTTATTSVTGILGHLCVDNLGTLQWGTSGSPIPAATPFTWSWASTADSTTWSFSFQTGSTVSMYGAGYTGNKALFVSGLGTAASPLITDGDIGNVGDQIVVTAASNNTTNYNESEARYIITKNSTTSYVLSNTSGGAENALVNSHTSAAIINLSGSINVTTSTVFGWGMNNNNPNAVFRYCRWERIGSTQTAEPGVQIDLGGGVTMDNVAIVSNVVPGVRWTSASVATHSNIVGYLGSTTNLSAIGAVVQFTPLALSCSNKTFVDCSAVAQSRGGFYLLNAYNNTFIRPIANSCNIGAATVANYAGITIASSSNNTFTGGRINANRNRGIVLQTGTDNTFIDCQIGNIGNNVIDVDNISSTYNQALFTNSYLSSTTPVNNYLNALTGTLIRVHKLGQVNNTHKWYTVFGTAQSTGAALADTTVRTTSSLGVRLSPENATTGFSWSFNIPAKQNSIVGFTGYLQRSAAFSSGSATVSMFLPGSTVADASYTLPTTTGSWLPVNISANYLGTVDGLATIVINAQSSTASAYLYADDFYNAGDGTTTFDKVTGLDVWDKGQPSPIIAPQTPSAADIAANVLDAQLSAHTSSGTVGLRLNQASTKGDLAAFID